MSGVEMDLSQHRYASVGGAAAAYCQLVAGVVGRMCVRIFGFESDDALERADSLGAALQLINILRDVREDASMGRVYLPRTSSPASASPRRRCSPASPTAPGPRWSSLRPPAPAACTRRASRSAAHIPGPARACVRTMAGIYSGILDRIEAEPELPLRQRVRLSSGEKAEVMVRSWAAAARAGR